MDTAMKKDDLKLNEAFSIILSIESFSEYITDIAEIIYKNELDRENLLKILKEHKIHKIEDIKEELLDLLIVYINIVLNDHQITENECRNVKILKMYFKIKEGDFYNKRHDEIKEILQRQFEILYRDNLINKEEAIYNVELQAFFDLSYDQFDELKNNEILKALEQGADISDLDTARFPKSFKNNNWGYASRDISQEVKDLVWNRDQGRCRQCGSTEKLEFDHIIPFSKGGSNTYRNIQLLCETCNRKKLNKIG